MNRSGLWRWEACITIMIVLYLSHCKILAGKCEGVPEHGKKDACVV